MAGAPPIAELSGRGEPGQLEDLRALIGRIATAKRCLPLFRMVDNGKRYHLQKVGLLTVKLTEHAAELLEAVRAQRQEPVESILEHALEALAREEHIESGEMTPNEDQRRAVGEMMEFVERNHVHLGAGLSVKDLIHEGHRI